MKQGVIEKVAKTRHKEKDKKRGEWKKNRKIEDCGWRGKGTRETIRRQDRAG